MAPSKLFSGQRKGRVWRHPACAGALAVLAILLFSWPFVRLPRLTLWLAYLHLFGCWGAVIVVLRWRSRFLRPDFKREGLPDD